MSKEQEMQKKIVQFQILESNLKMLQERADMISQKIDEFQLTKQAISDLESTEPSKAMIPLGCGNFVLGTVENMDEIIVNVGNNIALKKKRKDAIRLLDERITDAENDLNDITKKSHTLIKSLERLQIELQQMQG
ncbi:MAG: prefoldin subunit alpha [Candidatus Aenigmarchaeota archaeon]|nr:prefoldin subunit alpha [Candidatus Aenigmarchaeota archaeon]